MRTFIKWIIDKTVEGTIIEDKNATKKEKIIAWCTFILMIVSIPNIFVGLFLLAEQSVNTEEYYRSAEVFRIENQVVYLEDTQGYIWTVEDDTLQKYARYILVMDSCGTEDITDDIILEIK